MEKARHKRDQCMECSQPPVYEVLWANGHGHAWFCDKHFKEWVKENRDDILSVKEVKDGEAASKFAENTNPNIRDRFIKKDETSEKIEATNSRLKEIDQSLLTLRKDLEIQTELLKKQKADFEKDYMAKGETDYKKVLYSVDVKYLNKLSKENLRILHKKAHEFYDEYHEGKFKDLEILLNVHLLIIQEMEKRLLS